ncbi:energy transducer TonB [Pedobacter sp.]|uniref:energy transducer TonB n=1 Tax=Pedobacter sp. TaxID=1411316 RepID=UPI003BAA3739
MNKDWLDIDVLEDYLDGKLDAKTMHLVERQELEDPFVAEALEGLRQSPKRKQHISILQNQLYHRIANEPLKRKMWGITTQRLSIAATATVAFIAVSILFFMRETNRRNDIAKRKDAGVIVNLDTTAVVAATPPAVKDSVPVDGAQRHNAIIDKAIKQAKTGDLAKNSKTFHTEVKAKEEEKVNTFSAQESKTAVQLEKVQAIAAAAPGLASNKPVYVGSVIAQDGKPISGAVVKTASDKHITATDANGFFALPLDSADKRKEILVKAQGYNDKIVSTDPNAIRMALSGDRSLNEIAAITGSNVRKKERIEAPKIVLRADQNLNGKSAEEATKPIPVSTIDYNQYLENNNKLYTAKGNIQYVIVRFKVKKNGRPADVKVIKSIDKKTDAEARRLIMNGPDWVLPKNGTDEVELSIKF